MFLEKNRDRIEKDFEDFSRELPGKAEEIKKRMEALSPDIVIGMKYLYSNMPTAMWETIPLTLIWIMCSRESISGEIPLCKELSRALFPELRAFSSDK
mgnify:CR=1 FL=1